MISELSSREVEQMSRVSVRQCQYHTIAMLETGVARMEDGFSMTVMMYAHDAVHRVPRSISNEWGTSVLTEGLQ